MSAGQTQAERDPRSFRSHLVPATDRLSRLSYWLLAALLLAVLAFWTIASNENYRVIFAAVSKGVWTTIYVSILSFVLAILMGWYGA